VITPQPDGMAESGLVAAEGAALVKTVSTPSPPVKTPGEGGSSTNAVLMRWWNVFARVNR